MRLQNQLEALLEEAHIKLSSLVSDLLVRRQCTPFARYAGRVAGRAELHLIEQQIGQLDQEIAQPPSPASGCSRAAGRDPRSGGGLGATNHCRGRCHGGDLPLSEESRVVGGSMPRRGRKRGRELQQTLAQRQPPDAPHSESSCQCCRQTQRKHLRDYLSSFGAAPRAQQNHRGHCTPPVPADLDSLA